MTDPAALTFDDPGLAARLDELDADGCDALGFGLIGFDADTVVRRYNRFESTASGLSVTRVIGQPLFTVVAPCMNNDLVAQRYEDAVADDVALDVTLDYVLTLRMRPAKVRLRLLASPGAALRHVLVQWRT